MSRKTQPSRRLSKYL